MSAPAGWYDDGSGRQRWWDGERWTESFAPEPGSAAPAGQSPSPEGSGYTSPPAELREPAGRVAPVLGLIGLGLAVLGTVLACIPATFLFGVVVLIASFVVSVIGLFTRNAAKWPSIVGMILSVTGGVIGTIVTLIIVAASIAGPSPAPPAEPAPPAPATSSPPADTASERPSPEEIGVGVEELALAGGMTADNYPPNFFLCMGEYFYDSELSDEALQSTAAGQDIVDAERDLAIEVSTEAALSCDP